MKLKLSKFNANWPIVSIEEISTKVTDGEHATPERAESGVLLLSARNVLNGQLDLSVVDYIPDSEYRRIIKRCHPEAGDILISCSGTIGRVCVVPNKRKFTLVRSVALIKLDASKASSGFIAYSLQSELLQNQMKRALNLSAQPNLFLNAINKLKLPLPELCQQQKITEILEVWDDAIATTEKLITAKQKLKYGLSQRLIFGNQRLVDSHEFEYQKHKWFSVPSDWGLVPISKVAKSVSCKNADRLDIPVLSCTKHFGLVDSLEYFGKQIFSEDTSTYKVVKQHEFAYATNHIEEGSIGYQNLYEAALVSPMYTVFRVIDNQLSDDYLFKVLKTEVFRHIFQANTSASVDRRGSLRWSQFSQLKIPIPPLKEQSAICSMLNAAQQEIDCLNRYKESVQKQKHGLMQKLLTGEWSVKVKEAA